MQALIEHVESGAGLENEQVRAAAAALLDDSEAIDPKSGKHENRWASQCFLSPWLSAVSPPPWLSSFM